MAKTKDLGRLSRARKRIAGCDSPSLFLNGLDLSDEDMALLCPEIAALTQLQKLNLSDNLLTTLPSEIAALTQVQMLDLSENQITVLPPEIAALTQLRGLNLSDNQIAALPPEIAALTQLNELDLSANQVTALPPEIGALTQLRVLLLWVNQLRALPPEVAALAQLQTLDLYGNQLTTFPPEIAALTELQVLDLADNRMTALTPEIAAHTRLQSLHLADNQLTALPSEIAELTQLQVLNLSNNKLTALPAELRSCISLAWLFLHGNHGLGLPSEVLGPKWTECAPLGTRDPAAAADILDYYFATRAGARALREVKLILVGRGEVGKTTLAEVLQGRAFRKNRPRTDGISISRWPVKPRGGQAVVRIWDFGGQEIMHGTHQFFLTRRAIYVVMVDGRDDRYQREAEYWLKLVRAFGGDSTVMVVMNRQKDYKFDLDRNALAHKYGVAPDLFFATECSRKTTIRPVSAAILKLVANLLSHQANFPEKWWAVKAALEGMTDDYLSDAQYRMMCAANGVREANEQDTLLERLSDLGTVVHFPDDHLADLKVLDPEWATDGVYRVVSNERLREQKQGKLKFNSLKEILPKKRWPAALHRRYIIDLMLRFDLCFPAEGENDVFIVPDLLPQNTPNISAWDAKACVVFRYKYPVLPHGVLPRFISKTHRMSEGRDRWRSGVVIAKDGAEALVRADYDANIVDIWVRGDARDARRALLTIARCKFDEIHNRFKELDPDELVAVPRNPTVFVSYRDMILDLRRGSATVPVTLGNTRGDILIEEVLSGVESREQQVKAIELAGTRGREAPVPGKTVYCETYNEGGTHMRDMNMRDNYGQVAEIMNNCWNMVQRQAAGKKQDLLKKLRADVDELMKNLPKDKRDEAPQIADNLEITIKQATNEKPNRKWYSISAEGLLEAAAWVKGFSGEIGGTIKSLGKLLWPDFELPAASSAD
ncbi:MAG: leucine-rich repeat domain-containing protein [Phycisphaerales bacterium]|nr:leucine-rich repeat domain-containing protein [Phycisphaerales bacterium]